MNRSGGNAAAIFCSERLSLARFLAVHAPGARNWPRSKSITLTIPSAIEQNVVRVQIRVIDAVAVQARDRRADSTPDGSRKRACLQALRLKVAPAKCAP